MVRLSAFLLLFLCCAGFVQAADVTLVWDDPNNDPANVNGYHLSYWQEGQTPTVIDTGLLRQWTVTGLSDGATYTFAATAYDAAAYSESPYSNLVIYTVSSTSPESGLLAAYGFDEGSGGTTADVTGHGYAGSLVNGVGWVCG